MWQTSVQWSAGSLRGILVPDHPADGIQFPSLPGSLFQLALEHHPLPRCTESYVRGRDVFVNCPSDQADVAIQAYYRDLSANTTDNNTPGIELILSAQTNTLGTSVAMSIGHCLPGEVTPWEESSSAFCWRQDHTTTALLIVHPSDFHLAECQGGELHCKLFPDTLEKGVIRRGRLRCYFGPQDAATCRDLYNAFLNAPLPLTT